MLTIFILIILLSSFIRNFQSYTWDYAPKNILEETYFPYEMCILNSPELYNVSETPHSQSRCKHKLDSRLASIPKRCWLGSRQQTADYGMCLNKYWGCLPLANRTGFWKHWSDLPKSFKSSQGYEIDFLSAIKAAKFEMVAFTGDSMAVQLTQHLLCKILRTNTSYIRALHSDLNIISSGGNIASILTDDHLQNELDISMYKLPSGIGTSTVRGRYAMKGIDKCKKNDTCRQLYATDHIYFSTLKQLKTGPKWRKTLHILLFPIINKLEWEYKPFASAIIHAAKQMKAINSAILILSPMNQHFHNHKRGLYSDDPFSKHTAAACSPLPPPPISEHPDSIYMKKALDSLDSNWKRYIGYFDASFVSEPWHDMHPELHATGWAVDCTHVAYSPFMFGPLWADLGAYIRGNSSLWHKQK
eukprot:gene13304-28185_t